MSIKIQVYFFALCVFNLLGAEYATAQELRNWESADGGFTVSARLFARFENQVLLEKADGQRLTVRPAQLCSADNKYLETQQLAQFDLNRYQSVGEPVDGEMDQSTARTLSLDSESDWHLPQIPQAPSKLRDLGSFSVGNYEGKYLYSKLTRDPEGKYLLWVDDKGFNVAAAFDLTVAANVGKLFKSNWRGWLGAGLSSDGKWAVLYNPSATSIKEPLRIGLVKAGSTKIVLQWLTNERHSALSNKLLSAVFINEWQLVTTDKFGLVNCWDLHQRKLDWRIQLPAGVVPTFSHDRRFMIGCTGEKLFLFDLNQQQFVGSTDFNVGNVDELSLSPNGRFLMVVDGTVVRLLDAQTASILDSWIQINAKQIVGWNSSQQVVVGRVGDGTPSVRVVDIEQPENSYGLGGGQIAVDGLGRVWALEKDSNSESVKLSGYSIPAIPKAADGSTTGQLVIGPGAAVNLKVTAIVHDASPELYRELKKKLSDELKAPFSDKGDFSVKPTVGQTEIPTYDASEEARAIVIGLLEEAGLLVDPAADYTLHVELGHPAKLTRIYKDTMESTRFSGSPFSTDVANSWALRLQMFLVDKNGEYLVRSIIHDDSPIGVGDENTSPMFRSSVGVLERIAIPRKFIYMPPRSKSFRLNGGKLSVIE